MYYVQKDYLGSFYCITDENGNIVENNHGEAQVYSFDPCSVKPGFREQSEPETQVELIPYYEVCREGRRRNPQDWTYYHVPKYIFDRGFTGHQHMDMYGLINMNGRLYDPRLGRMLSPDPFVQAPGYSQSYNRYSYVFNNPLKYIDPSGYFGGAPWDKRKVYMDGGSGGIGGSGGMIHQFDYNGRFGSGGIWERWTNTFRYEYDWNTGKYYRVYQMGGREEVSYNEVFYNYVVPNATFITGDVMGLTDKGSTDITIFTDFAKAMDTKKLNKAIENAIQEYLSALSNYYSFLNELNSLGHGYGMMFDGEEGDPPGGDDDLNGIITIGLTGTFSAGLFGGSLEIGIAFDGEHYSIYLTLEHAVGADLSGGVIVNYLSPHNGNLTFSEAEGWSESYNGAAWVFDGTYGGNSQYSGLNPKKYSDYHSLYNTFGFGVSLGLPIGFTLNKGYTWYFLKF